jgi:hypothetical protein
MHRDPILAAKSIRPVLGGYPNVWLTFKVEGGLHFIKANGKPYFTLTYTSHRKGFPNQCYSGGAGHDEILKHYPKFADLAALHLSDIDGVPMHAEANGWYSLAGALGGAGQQYHAGNSKRHCPIVPPADKPWQNTEYREPTQAECLQIFADHCRIPIEEAQAIRDRVAAKWNFPDMRSEWRAIMETMRPRWKAEAEACIAKHNLRVFGDEWPVAA